jgi:hypothetical protein
MGQDVRSPRGPRCIALVGPFQSGKTTLLEAILARTGAIPRAGSVDAGTSIGDSSPEARRHKMGVGLTAATANFMGDSYTFIDCPGSVEFAHDMRAALPAVDAAVVVCEADEKKLPQLQLILRELEDLGITEESALTWAVFAPSVRLGPGDLSGNYAGAQGSASIGVGLGGNVLVGGSDNSIALQPLSVQGQVGLSVAAGLESLELRPGR